MLSSVQKQWSCMLIGPPHAPCKPDFTHSPITWRHIVDNFLDTQHFLLWTMRGVLAYMRNLAQWQKYAGVFPEQLWNAALLWFQGIIIESHTHVCLLEKDDRGVLRNESNHSISIQQASYGIYDRYQRLTFAFSALIAFWIPFSTGSLSGFVFFLHRRNPEVAICLATLILNRASDQRRSSCTLFTTCVFKIKLYWADNMFFNSAESLISSISMRDRHLPQGKVLCFLCRPNQLRQNPDKQIP